MASINQPERLSTLALTAREDSVTPPDYKLKASPSKMFTVQSMLNAPATNDDQQTVNPTGSTSAYPWSTITSTGRSDTPTTTSSARKHNTPRSAPIVDRGHAGLQSNHLPFELSEDSICLSRDERNELVRQQRLFRIKPSDSEGEGRIRDNTRFIPYSSDKKSFYSKTGKEGFNVCQYTFRVPNDPAQTEYTVMWDHDNGLTRITPFFKACSHSKTVPAKALSTNPGLKDLAHSITGGALAAQGYWIPYACARAICLTFCYHIRWALTPIFGPSFIRECLPPHNAGYQRFKIDSETIRCATLEAEGWKQASQHTTSPADIPRSVPQTNASNSGKELRPRDTRSMFKSGSPFQSDEESTYGTPSRFVPGSPSISPKSSVQETFTGPTWTSVNGDHHTAANSSNYILPKPLSHSLLNQPRQCASWRPANPIDATTTTVAARKASLRSHRQHQTLKRRRSSSASEDVDADADAQYNDDSSPSETSSEASDEIETEPPRKKRANRGLNPAGKDMTPVSHSTVAVEGSKSARSKKFTAEDFRVAHLLLALNHDDHLAWGPKGPVRK